MTQSKSLPIHTEHFNKLASEKPVIIGDTNEWNGSFIFDGVPYSIEPTYISFVGVDIQLEVMLFNRPELQLDVNTSRYTETRNEIVSNMTIGDIENFIMGNKNAWNLEVA